MRFFKTLLFPVVLLAPLLVLGGCSVNPATGKQSFTAFMSPEKEKEVGASEHPKILDQFSGAYDDPDLGFYVARIGAKLAKHAELPDLTYTFTVLNDENVNAFALPGGYVYITRGLLAIAANEAEMAGVLAHEIGHITARHTAQRYSATMATNIGLQVLSVLGSVAGAPTGSGQLAAFGAQAALQSYSREQELEADMLGVRYLSRSGYDPNAMTSFFEKLKAHTELRAAMLGEKAEESLDIMATHPLTSERIVEAEKLAAVAEAHGHEVAKEAYDQEIEGLLFGDDPDQGIRRGRVFEHPVLGFRFEVPPGFTMVNTPQRVIAKDEVGSVIVFDNSDAKKVQEVGGIEKYIRAINFKGSKFSNIETLNVNGMAAVTGVVRLSIARTTRDVRLLVIQESPENVYRFWFDTEPEKTEAMALDFRRTTHSFKRLDFRPESAKIKPLRIRLETVRRGDTTEAFAKRMPMENFGLEWFKLLNDMDTGEPLIPGSKVRIVAK